MMYSIPKLYIKNNLPNTTKCENKYFSIFMMYLNTTYFAEIEKLLLKVV